MLLLDTHAFVWLVSDPDQISHNAWNALEEGEEDCVISMVTGWEIALLYKLRRLKLPRPPTQYISLALENHGITELPLTREVILQSVELPDIHKDPFDRILIAEAQIRKATLITKDRTIAAYPGIQVIW